MVYEDDLGYYAFRFSLFSMYLISGARVKKSQVKYGRLIHRFYWVIEMKLDLAPFAAIKDIPHSPAIEIGMPLPLAFLLCIFCMTLCVDLTPRPGPHVLACS